MDTSNKIFFWSEEVVLTTVEFSFASDHISRGTQYLTVTFLQMNCNAQGPPSLACRSKPSTLSSAPWCWCADLSLGSAHFRDGVETSANLPQRNSPTYHTTPSQHAARSKTEAHWSTGGMSTNGGASSPGHKVPLFSEYNAYILSRTNSLRIHTLPAE